MTSKQKCQPWLTLLFSFSYNVRNILLIVKLAFTGERRKERKEMTVFTARVSMKGLNGKIVHKIIDLGNFDLGGAAADYAGAETAIGQITGALAAVSDAALSQVTLTSVVSTDPAAGGGDVYENALVNVFLDAAGEKTTQLYVPAPTQGVFLATEGVNRDVIDTADADLIQYVQQISQHAFISDGEQIDTTVNNGMKNGIRVVKNLKLG